MEILWWKSQDNICFPVRPTIPQFFQLSMPESLMNPSMKEYLLNWENILFKKMYAFSLNWENILFKKNSLCVSQYHDILVHSNEKL